MKRTACLILTVLTALSLLACGSKKEETPTLPTASAEAVPVQAETKEAESGAASMANPMREVTDTGEFSRELGIAIDADMLFSDAKLFIIDGKIAECRFDFENIGGETVETVLRATKDEAVAENLHGVYDSTLKEIQTIPFEYSEGSFVITVQENEAKDTLIYTWQIDDTWFSLMMKGKPSQMEVAEVMDSVMFALGVETDSYEEAAVTAESWYYLSEEDEVLNIRLEANATTGFQWTCKIWDEGSLELISEEYIPDSVPAGLVGAGGTWVASFRATGPEKRNNFEYPCSNYVTFKYARDWEDSAADTKVIDLNIVGTKLEIMGVHEPDFSQPKAEDGTYAATLDFTNMIEENDLSVKAVIGIPEIVTFTDEEIKKVKVGDVIPLSAYGLIDSPVDRLNKLDEKNIEINDAERFSYREDLGAWVIVGPDDDITKYNKEYRTVQFTNETEIDDQMEAVIKSGNSGTIYDKMRSYRHVDAEVTVKDGVAKKITIYYHP